MKLSDDMIEALGGHIQVELQASYFYLALSSYFETMGLSGYSAWMRAQSGEERGHALRIVDYLQDRHAPVKLGPLDAPQADFSSPLDAMRRALKNEQEVSERIRALYRQATKTEDEATSVFLHWFITEQVEEEKTFEEEVERLELAGDNSAALLLLDTEAGSRESED